MQIERFHGWRRIRETRSPGENYWNFNSPSRIADPIGSGPVGLSSLSSEWEATMISRFRLQNGEFLDDTHEYKVALTDFILQGGDEMANVVRQIDERQIDYSSGISVREAVVDFFSRHRPRMNTALDPVVPFDSMPVFDTYQTRPPEPIRPQGPVPLVSPSPVSMETPRRVNLDPVLGPYQPGPSP